MAGRLHYTPAAIEDLDAIERFIEQDSPASAERFLQEIYARCRALAETPLMGVARPDLGKGFRLSGLRRRAAIVYRPEAEQTVIVRVLYGGRDLATALAEGAGEP